LARPTTRWPWRPTTSSKSAFGDWGDLECRLADRATALVEAIRHNGFPRVVLDLEQRTGDTTVDGNDVLDAPSFDA
jgi:hypothetical protein